MVAIVVAVEEVAAVVAVEVEAVNAVDIAAVEGAFSECGLDAFNWQVVLMTMLLLPLLFRPSGWWRCMWLIC